MAACAMSWYSIALGGLSGHAWARAIGAKVACVNNVKVRTGRHLDQPLRVSRRVSVIADYNPRSVANPDVTSSVVPVRVSCKLRQVSQACKNRSHKGLTKIVRIRYLRAG
jgi:hypothetical protein